MDWDVSVKRFGRVRCYLPFLIVGQFALRMGVLKSLRIREATNQEKPAHRFKLDSGNIEVVELVSVHEAIPFILMWVGSTCGGSASVWTVHAGRTVRLILNAPSQLPWPGRVSGLYCGSSVLDAVDTHYQDGVLTFDHAQGDMQWYAYFAPYTYEQHLDLLSACQTSGSLR